ncbi:hypothetical protein DFJ74DRAFT_650112 [Hyaloraphidium curvatum]|nr:hypothetical protein DFJ74DRAFT_650112 [Hyaloraphidium curvatum]
MNVLVSGATGEVGRGIAAAFLARGASRVFILGRSADKLEAVKQKHLGSDPRAVPVAADYSTEAGAREAARKVQELLAGEKLDHVVSSSGPWWQVPSLAGMDPAKWREAMAANVDAHFYAYRFLIGLTKGSFQIVNGAAKDGLPGIGLTGITANAVDGFARVAAHEAKRGGGARVYNVLLASSVGHAAQRGRTNDPAEYGHAFVAIALGKAGGTEVALDDAAAARLIASL